MERELSTLVLFGPFMLVPWLLAELLFRLVGGHWMDWGWKMAVMTVFTLSAPVIAFVFFGLFCHIWAIAGLQLEGSCR